MRLCIFCQATLSANNRAKEHVFRNSWLRALGHKKTGISFAKFSTHGFISDRSLAADQLQAGEVCANCNGGWMNHLDLKVEHIVLGLARTPGEGIHLSQLDARTVGRWLLKTACSFVHTDSRERRHVPRSVLSNIRRDNYLPPGFVAFAARSLVPIKHVAISSWDVWPETSSGNLLGMPQTQRLKFGIQYDNVILGCSYVNCAAPVFTGVAGLHLPFLKSRAKFVLTAPPPGDPDQWLELPEEVNKTVLNLFLLLIGVTQPS